MKDIKVIPVYLPQFHAIPENDEWWGKGFTEWVNVKGAKPLFEGHNQPRVPLNKNYYDLNDVETLKWQCKMAKEYGIYGFCMYHYWFSGKVLLHRPMELLLTHPEININYCISWANGEWRDTWKYKDAKSTKILIYDDYNNEKLWVDHFNYMLPFFKDNRYMKENNKPILVIYTPHIITKLNKMLDLWTQMAKKEGFEGITYIYQSAASSFDRSWDKSRFEYGIEMNPGYVNGISNRNIRQISRLMKYSREIKRILHINRRLLVTKNNSEIKQNDYDEVWQKILQLRPNGTIRMIPCAFTDWDNSPRFGINGSCYTGVTPQKFKHYFALLVENAKKYYKSDKIFVFAWNEWAEGGYLEPDELYGTGFLEAIKEVLDEQN
ncbi:glycoside hydrolase family 99-like domain-containing protein [uncultured Bacteroides sp.]|uniref:glycosyltransferase WbsX family protein n=1 Tax=uncultured Bacteroides sp. TaxID=162156 RepID=UPI0025ED82B6|nr:glycoside hydrolase family 99-like domain-containing protein [uncultured Bacteroides sp.]